MHSAHCAWHSSLDSSVGSTLAHPNASALACLWPHRQLLGHPHGKHMGYTSALICAVQARRFGATEGVGPNHLVLQQQGRQWALSRGRLWALCSEWLPERVNALCKQQVTAVSNAAQGDSRSAVAVVSLQLCP